MLHNITDYLRRFAFDLNPQETRVVNRNRTDIHGDPLPEESVPDESSVVVEEGGHTGLPGAPMKAGKPEEVRPTSGPMQRAPRRQPGHARKWNPDTRRQRMREYMRNYRGTGQINQRKPQTTGA